MYLQVELWKVNLNAPRAQKELDMTEWVNLTEI